MLKNKLSFRQYSRLKTCILLGPALGVILLLFGGGLFWGLLQSLGYLPAVGIEKLTFIHYLNILEDPDFLLSLGLTFYISSISTLIALVLGTAVALALFFSKEKSKLLSFILQIPLVIPHLVIAISVIFMFSPTGIFSRLAIFTGLIDQSADFPLLINDDWGLGIIFTYIWKEVPFICMMIFPLLNEQGKELLEAGKTLKATPWQRFRYIILPLIFPALESAGMIVFAFSFGAFEIPWLLGQRYPALLPVWAYQNYTDVDLMARPEGIATGIIIALIIMISIFISRLFFKRTKQVK